MVVNDNVVVLHGRRWFQSTVRERARDSSQVVIVDHARQQMAARDIALAEVLRVLRCGTCEEEPQPGHGSDVRARMAGKATGREIVVVAAVPTHGELVIVVTAWLAGDKDLGSEGEGGS